MKVELVKDCPIGKKGTELSGPSVWRNCFPIRGCVAKPKDEDAVNAVAADLAGLKGETLQRMLVALSAAGVWPVELPKPPEVKPVLVKASPKKPEPKAVEPTEEELEAMTKPEVAVELAKK